MESAFGLHLSHSSEWNAKISQEIGVCPGKDPIDTRCTCTDLVYSTRIRIATGTTFNNYFYCGCCDLPVFRLRPVPA